MLIARGSPGVDHDFNAYNAAGNVWNGGSFVPWDDADFTLYRIPATALGTSGRFVATPPAGTTYYELRVRALALADSFVVYNDNLLTLDVATGTEVVKGRGVIGDTHDFFFFNSANEVWQTTTSTFVTWNDANFANYRVPAVAQGTSGVFQATAPAGAETYELRLREATLGDSGVVDHGPIKVSTGIALPPDPSQTTGLLKTFNNAGVAEAGVVITVTVADVITQMDAGVPTEISGVALDNTPRAIASDSSGIVEIPGLFKGVIYNVKRGENRTQTVKIPLNAGSTYQIPVIIGNP